MYTLYKQKYFEIEYNTNKLYFRIYIYFFFIYLFSFKTAVTLLTSRGQQSTSRPFDYTASRLSEERNCEQYKKIKIERRCLHLANIHTFK